MEPTPSEKTNDLIRLCLTVAREAAEGAGLTPQTGEAAELDAALHRCDLELHAAQASFLEAVLGEAGLQEALQEPIAAVVEAFNGYSASLDLVADWFESGQLEPLSRAPGEIAQACNALFEALSLYEWAYLGWGEEPHPALNLVSKALPALEDGSLSSERFDELLDQLWQQFSEGVTVFEAEPDPLRSHRGVQSCRQALAGLQEMDQWFETGDRGHLARGYQRLRQGCLLLIEQIQEGVGEALVQRPTPSPQVNWVIQAARAVQEGASTPDLLLRAIEWFEPQLAESYFQFEQGATSAMSSLARALEPIQQARQGFDRLNRALPLLRVGVERAGLLERALDLLQDGARTLHSAWERLSEEETLERLVRCLRCEALHPPEVRACSGCGASLPRPAHEPTPGPAPGGSTPAHLHRLLLACEETEAGRMEAEEFAQVLDWARRLVRHAHGSMARIPTRDQLELPVQQASATLERGLAQVEQALDVLERHLQDGAAHHLTAGARLLSAAFEALLEVQVEASTPPG